MRHQRKIKGVKKNIQEGEQVSDEFNIEDLEVEEFRNQDQTLFQKEKDPQTHKELESSNYLK